MSDLARLAQIREHRTARARQVAVAAEATEKTAALSLRAAQESVRAHRHSLPPRIAAAFAPLLQKPIGLNQLNTARQTEAELRAELARLVGVREEAQRTLDEARTATAAAKTDLQTARRKEEAVTLLHEQQTQQAAAQQEKKSDEALDEFAEQAYARE